MLNINTTHELVTDTKLKILIVANELFSRQGFDGVSVRDIAKKADVNVASINYHFKNKLGLLHEIFAYNYQWFDKEISEIAMDSNIDAAEISVKIFNLFLENRRGLINSFKMIVTDHLCPDEAIQKDMTKNEPLGPPGGKAILEVITREVGEGVSQEKRDWAMRMIFSNIIHTAIIMGSTYFKRGCCDNPLMQDPEVKKEEFRELARALVDRIQKNP